MNPILLAALIEIGKGILQALGAKIFESIAGNGGQDMTALFKSLITAISDIVKQQLDDNDIQAAVAEVASFQGLLNEYNNSPSTRLFTLQDLVDKSASYPISTLGALLDKYPSAALAYAGGGLFRLAVLQEYAKRTGAAGDFKNFVEFAASISKSLKDCVEPLRALNEARVTPVQERSEPDGYDHEPDPQPIYNHICYYYVDGSERQWVDRAYDGDESYPTDQAVPAHDADLARIRSDFQNGAVVPLNQITAQLDQIAALKSLAPVPVPAPPPAPKLHARDRQPRYAVNWSADEVDARVDR